MDHSQHCQTQAGQADAEKRKHRARSIPHVYNTKF